MNKNYRGGFARIAIVASIVWIAMFAINERAGQERLRVAEAAYDQGNIDNHGETQRILPELHEFNQAKLSIRAERIGFILWPIIVVFVLMIGLWIKRGFKPKAPQV